MTEPSEKILLIGGCGYIGAALYQHLFRRGWQIESVDLEWFGNGANRRNVRRDYAHLTHEDLAPYGTVILLAGHASPGMCRDVRASLRNNVLNFVELLEELRGGQRLIYASDASVYGPERRDAVTEEDELGSPASHYDLTKHEIERYARLSDVDCVGLRLGAVNGMARHLRGDMVINRMVSQYMSGASEITVSDPEAVLPILGMRDLVHAVERLLVVQKVSGPIYNLASFSATVEEVADRVARAVGVEFTCRAGVPAPYDVNLSAARFTSDFDFTFADTVESITGALVAGWSDARVTTRVEQHPYG